MKLRNSTDWPDFFLRRMVAWCCREVGLPVRKLHEAQFRNRSRGRYSGHTSDFPYRIVASIGPAENFPCPPDKRDGMAGEVVVDRMEALVAITAHELEHIRQFVTGDSRKIMGRTEARTMAVEVRVLRAFRTSRESLLTEWSIATVAKPAKPTASIQEKRAAKVADDLARWQRKLKLAQTKIRKLRQRVRYYERIAACGEGAIGQ